MVTIDNNEISMTRGDTLLIRVVVTIDGEPYMPLPGDSVRFALKHDRMDSRRTKFKDEDPLILKDVPTTTMLLRLDPADTKPLAFGDYVYDMQITFSDGFVRTFIPTTKFTLCPEVE